MLDWLLFNVESMARCALGTRSENMYSLLGC